MTSTKRHAAQTIRFRVLASFALVIATALGTAAGAVIAQRLLGSDVQALSFQMTRVVASTGIETAVAELRGLASLYAETGDGERLKSTRDALDRLMLRIEGATGHIGTDAAGDLAAEVKAAAQGLDTASESEDRAGLFARTVLPALGRLADKAGTQGEAALDAQVAIDDAAEAHRAVAEVALALLGGLGAILGIVLALLVVRSVIRPLGALAVAMRGLAAGELETAVPENKRGDEIADLATAVGIFKANAVEARRLAEAEKAEIERKESRRLTIEREIAAFELRVGDLLEVVATSIDGLGRTAKTLDSSAGRNGQQADTLATTAMQASDAAQTVAAAAEELTASIRSITEQVGRSTATTDEAVKRVDDAQKSVSGLAAATETIERVVSLIAEIAAKTNLLALNATIEAARAGEAGRGFAVVANEVKTLAQQTARATQEITGEVEAMRQAMSHTVGVIGEIGATIRQVSDIAGEVSHSVAQQDQATREIAASVRDAADGASQVSNTVGEVANAAGETGAAAADVLAAAQNLADRAGDLRGSVGGFLSNIRAA